ncbi:hypothetical protein A1O3_07213 [Capronia epimyces CBS 606.96]|uniref:Uncharacterized protein n=1 Tax=Capronia epimyces CBS 606.96 TaxID=1182542 RepID=W9XUC1_9EURO|nr:uncharacterized protein A1O3_07213 [Capronia epimyces CBS 606.96]EXJ80925.1 hypothetical protein A1O3_07213 [Capronia epimyces CBS 606.96]
MDRFNLSKNDACVLSALFDPESSLSNSMTVQVRDISREEGHLSALQEQEQRALRPLNQATPARSDIELCVSQLSAIIADNPSYASAWNNRAQARRMLVADADLSRSPAAVAEILQDLAQAIELATPGRATSSMPSSNSGSGSSSISSLEARVLASAHTHRGYLLLLASKSDQTRMMLHAVPGLRDLPRDRLAEAASRELALGGRYGNETARQLAVKTNPYAKLCGSIVREALTKEIMDFYQPRTQADAI